MNANMTQTNEEEDAFDREMRSFTNETDKTDGSDFTPAQLERIKRKISFEGAPLPSGVRGLSWEAPRLTGLEHSAPIFETEANQKGGMRLTSQGINDDNCHYRSWQEDNGVAGTFALKRVVKDVDGQARSVLISPGASLRISERSAIAGMTSDLRPMVRTSPTDSSVEESDEGGNNDARKEGTAGEIPLSVGDTNKQPSPVPRIWPVDVVGDEAEENPGVRPCSNVGSLICARISSVPSCPSTVGSTQDIPPTPSRPSGSSASHHGQQTRPGRSLSAKAVPEDVGLLVLERKQPLVQGTQRLHDVADSEVGCGLTVVVDDGYHVGASSHGSGITTGNDAAVTSIETVGVVSDGAITCEATTAGRGQCRQDCRHHEDEGVGTRDDARERTSPAPSAQEKTATTKSWWGGSRLSRLRKKKSSSTSLQEPFPERKEAFHERSHQNSRVRSEQPVQDCVLPSISVATGSSPTPRRRGWFSFRRRG